MAERIDPVSQSTSSRDQLITSMLPRLMAATCFEEAATAVLSALLRLADATLAAGEYPWAPAGTRVAAAKAASPPTSAGRLLRGVVHLRPESGYQRLFGVEHPGGAPVDGTGYLTSASVWRWVAEHRCSVSIDVQLGTLYPWLREGASASDSGEPPGQRRAQADGRRPDASAGAPGEATRERMLSRDTTHVHVVPLRAPAGTIDGMITIEASCKAAMGDDLLWEAACDSLELLAAVAAPYLAALPPRPAASAASPDPFLPVIGRNTASLVELLRVFARQEETVLISGPTGAGKSRLARFCHEHSTRRGHPFETLDLLSVPEELQMAELFGWKRGAFTGAVKDSAGAITRAAEGTLFVDEVDKLSLKAQAGLLRVLEERRFRPIGEESGDRRANVRFVIGTNADLRASVRAGRFREDLYYRINVLPVRLSPLAERLDELPAWADYMLQRRHTEAEGQGPARLTPAAVKLLVATPWPGNLRQLDNILRRAYALALVDRSASGVVLDSSHLERALGYDGPADASSLLAQLWRAARTFVQEAERRGDGKLALESCEALRGLVLAAAVLRRGRDDAFVLLGQQQLLKNRNHHRALRRELERTRELYRLVGGEIDPELAALLDSADEAAEGR